MNAETTLVLIRHTRLADTAAGVCYGRREMPLADTFPAEAAAVRAALPWTPAVIWTSPAQRCRALAEVLGTARVDPRLAELNFGAWEGRRWDELKGPDVAAWIQDPWHARPPQGETADELVERVRAFRDELLGSRTRERVAVVTHAGVIRAWRSLVDGISLADAFAQPVSYGQIFLTANFR